MPKAEIPEGYERVECPSCGRLQFAVSVSDLAPNSLVETETVCRRRGQCKAKLRITITARGVSVGLI